MFLVGGKRLIGLDFVVQNNDITFFVLTLFAFISTLFVFKWPLVFVSCLALYFPILFEAHNDFGLYKVSVVIVLVVTLYLYLFIFNPRIDPRVVLLYLGYILLFYCAFVFIYMVIFVGYSIGDRVVMGVNGPITYARYSLLSALLILFYSDRLMFNNAAIVSGGGLGLVSGSKGPLVAFIVSVLLYFFRTRNIKSLIILLSSSVATYLVIDAYAPRVSTFILDVFAILYDFDVTVAYSSYNYGSLGSRLDEWLYAIDVFNAKPYGVGLGQWGEYGDHIYPHNLVLELLVELGFYGLSFMLFLACIVLCIKNKESISILGFFFINSLFSGSLADSSIMIFFVLFFFTERHKLVKYEK